MAEIAGLALGVVGVAGLYSVTLQVFEQISDAANFDRDFGAQQAKLKTCQVSLRLWGSGTGFTAEGTLLADHHPVFDDDRVLYDVQSALFCIRDACTQLQACFDKSDQSSANARNGTGNPARTRVRNKISAASKRLRWAFQEKTKVEDLLSQVVCLVSLLYQIARPKDAAALESDTKLSQIIASNQEQSRRIAEGLVNQAKELQLRKQQDVETWLDAPRTHLVYHAALSKALPGTCQWVTEHAVLQKWTNSSTASQQDAEGIWFYSRIAGAGKTIAASKLVESLKTDRYRSLAYYFGTHESSTNLGFNGIVRGWILQLTRSYGWETVEKAYDASIDQDKPLDPWAVLRSMLTGNPSTYLVLDGLDEIEDRSEKYTTEGCVAFLRRHLVTIRKTRTHLVIFSRYEQDIAQVLSNRNNDEEHVTVVQSEIQLQQTATDIERVARHQVSVMFPSWTEEQRDQVATSLVKRADGMFVLLHAILEQLGERSTYGEVRYAVSQPLSGHSNTDMLQQAYRTQVERIVALPPAVRDFCLSVLLWVQKSARPLKAGELLDILRVLSRRDGEAFEIPRIQSQHDIDFHLLRHCALFLAMRSDAEALQHRTLHLVHYSVKEFLQYTGSLENSKFRNWKLFQARQSANAYLSKACLTYLLQSKFGKYPADRVSGASRGVFEYREGFSNDLTRNNMFYEYAAAFWWRHLDLSCSKPELVAFVESGAATKKTPNDETSITEVLRRTEQLLEVMSPKGTDGYEKFLPLDIELQDLCLEFLGLKGSDQACCNYKIWRHYHLGIWTAVDDDYLSRARSHLELPRSMFGRHWTSKPLWRSFDSYTWQNHLFTTYGWNHRDLRLQIRLLEAMCMHSIGVAAVLAQEGANINFTWPDQRRTLEIYATSTGFPPSPLFFQIFLTHFGATIETNKPVFPVHIPINGEIFRAAGGPWANPRILWGFLFGNVLQVKALNAWRFDDSSVFVHATNSDLDTIRTMLRFHIEVNNRSLFFPSAVHAAVLNTEASTTNKIRILKVLFGHGGDANVGPWLRPVGTFAGDSPRETLREMLWQLLPSIGVSEGRTFGSLLRLVEQTAEFDSQREELITVLLSKEAISCNSASWLKNEKLLLAVRRNDQKEVKRLLESGVNANRHGAYYGSALYVASYTGSRDLVELLLEHNADPNIAVHTRILPLELGKDFKWSGLWRKSLTKDGAMYSPLQAASYRGHHEVVKLLIEHGADVNQSEGEAGTALYFAVCAAQPKYLAAEWNQERTEGDELQYWRDQNNKDREKSMSLVSLLLDSGADVNKCGGRYWTPLQAACNVGELVLALKLLTRGADPNIRGGEWGTALQAAIAKHPDPDVEAVENGNLYDPDDGPPPVLPRRTRAYFITLLLLRIFPFPFQQLDHLARIGPPTDTAFLLAYVLLQAGANPTLLTPGPWTTAIHTASYFGSWNVLKLVLDSKYSDLMARTRAANTPGGIIGLAFNGAMAARRWDKAVLLLRDARAEYRWMPLLSMRIRKIGLSTFERLCWVLGMLWAIRGILVSAIVVVLAYAVCLPIYKGWEELDRKAKEWDPRLGGLWVLVSLLIAGYLNVLRASWAEDTPW